MKHEITGQFSTCHYQCFSLFQIHRIINLVLLQFKSQYLLQTFTACFGHFNRYLDLTLTEISTLLFELAQTSILRRKFLFLDLMRSLSICNLCKHKNKKTSCTEIIILNEPLLKKSCFTWKLLENNGSFSVFCLNSCPFLHFILYLNFQSISHMFHHFLRQS